MASSPVCIIFAGCIGSSKTPITHFLSTELRLPIHNNDTIRTEVTEDRGHFDPDEYLKRRNERLTRLMERGTSFICDASVDREWSVLKDHLSARGYAWFVISLDWSKEMLQQLYRAKDYTESLTTLDQFFAEHEAWLAAHAQDVGIRLSDTDFPNRLQICRDAVITWLAETAR